MWAIDLLNTRRGLETWKVSVIAMNGMAFELSSPHGRMLATFLSGIAAFKRDLINERVKSGLAAARARGRKLGRQVAMRPKSDKPHPKVIEVIDAGRSCRWVVRDLGISKNAFTRIVRRRREKLRLSFRPQLEPTSFLQKNLLRVWTATQLGSAIQARRNFDGLGLELYIRTTPRSRVSQGHPIFSEFTELFAASSRAYWRLNNSRPSSPSMINLMCTSE